MHQRIFLLGIWVFKQCRCFYKCVVQLVSLWVILYIIHLHFTAQPCTLNVNKFWIWLISFIFLLQLWPHGSKKCGISISLIGKKVGAQLHDSLGPASNLQKIFCAHIGNYNPLIYPSLPFPSLPFPSISLPFPSPNIFPNPFFNQIAPCCIAKALVQNKKYVVRDI